MPADVTHPLGVMNDEKEFFFAKNVISVLFFKFLVFLAFANLV
jgi:hypothetical protein